MLMFLVYFVETLSRAFETIGVVAGFTALITCAVFVFLRMISMDSSLSFTERDLDLINKIRKTCLIAVCIWATTLFVPDRESSLKIAAAYGVQVVAETVAANPEVQKAATNSLKLLNQTIEGYLEEKEQSEQPKDTK